MEQLKRSLSASLWWNAKSKNTDLDSNVWQLWPRTIFILYHSEKLCGWLAGNKSHFFLFFFFLFSFQKGKSFIMLQLLWGFYLTMCLFKVRVSWAPLTFSFTSAFQRSNLQVLVCMRKKNCLRHKTNNVTFTLLLFGLSAALSVNADVNSDCEGLMVGEWILCMGVYVCTWVQPGVWVSEWNTLCIQANTEASP